jgi:hypothetical protein
MNDRKGRLVRRIRWAVGGAVRALSWRIHAAIYYSKRNSSPGVIRSKWLSGLSDGCWQICCGHDLRFSLHIANIWWGLPLPACWRWEQRPIMGNYNEG